jgi:hypothetical protein
MAAIKEYTPAREDYTFICSNDYEISIGFQQMMEVGEDMINAYRFKSRNNKYVNYLGRDYSFFDEGILTEPDLIKILMDLLLLEFYRYSSDSDS